MVLVITQGSPENSSLPQDWLYHYRDTNKGADIIGLFNCQGDMSQQLIGFMLKSSNPQFVKWVKLAQKAPRGQPDANRKKS